MSSISLDDVKKLAALSALTLNDDEAKHFTEELANILGYIDQLQAVDVQGVQPTYQAHNLHTVTRADEVIDYGVSQAELLKNVPKQEHGQIVVPRVIE